MVLLRLGRIRTGPLGFPRGEAGRLDGSSEPARLTEEGWRQPKYCLHAVQWYQREIIADSFTTWRRGFIKQVPISTHRTLHKTFGARHPSSVTPRWGAPAIGSRYDCHRQPLLLKDSLRSATPPGEAKGAGTNSYQCIPNGILRTAGNPSGAMRRPQLCIKQLYAVEDGYTC